MSHLDWQSSDGITLKSLRQSAGMSVPVLAKKASLSTEQLMQLEEGGSHLFYSQAIKLRSGQRVLAILGFEFTEPPAIKDVPLSLVDSKRIIPVDQSIVSLDNRFRNLFLSMIRLRFFKDFLKKPHVENSDPADSLLLTPNSSPHNYLSRIWRSTAIWSCMGTAALAIIIYDFYTLHLMARF